MNSRSVDIVRDVANLVNARFAASVFSLPIKTAESPRGIYTEQELYQVLAIFFICVSDIADITKIFQIRAAAHTLAQQLGELILMNAEAISATGFIADVLAKLHHTSALTEYGIHMIQRLLDTRLSLKDIVWSHLQDLLLSLFVVSANDLVRLLTAAVMTVNQSGLYSQALDFYLQDGAKFDTCKQELFVLSQQNTKEADDKILK